MAVIGTPYIDLIDIYKQKGADGEVTAQIIELLTMLSPVLRSARVGECNQGTKHKHVIQTKLAEAFWGALYKGTPFSKSGTASVEDTTGFIETLLAIDTRLIDLNKKNIGQFMTNEATMRLESIIQTFETSFFYADTATTPDQIKGLEARYNYISGSGNGAQVIDGGGTGSDNTSIWMVTWGDMYTSLIHPEGVPGGVQRQLMGTEVPTTDSDGNRFYQREEKWTLHTGVSVGDYRFNTRIANIDVSDLKAGSVDLYDLLRQAYYRNRGRKSQVGGANCVIYCNTDVMEALDAQATNAGTTDNFVRLTTKEVQGEEVQAYRGKPIYETEHILNTEARVVAA